jgi:hypothetical protein
MAAAIFIVLAFAPTAQAQWRYGPRVRVWVGASWGYPYWGYPYWGWGYPYWGWGWGPYWGPWYGYPYYGHPDDNSAKVKLEVKPKDAQVYLDGYYVGTVDDFDGTFQGLRMAPGDHELVVYKPEFRTVKQKVRVRPRKDSKIRFEMQPLAPGEVAEAPPPPPAQEEQPAREAPPYRMPGRVPPREQQPPPGSDARSFGTLVLRVQPAGAEVLIDGEQWQGPEGEERLTVHVAEGPHRVEIRKEGFVPFATDVIVRRGETTPLNVSLPPRGASGATTISRRSARTQRHQAS